MPSAHAGFACCDRCATLGTTGSLGSPGPLARATAVATPGGTSGTAVATPGGTSGTAVATPAAIAWSAADGPARVARRRLLKAAVARRSADTGETSAGPAEPEPAQPDSAGFADVAQLPRTVSGILLDVSPHVLVIGDHSYEQRFLLTPDAVAWRGRQIEPALLRQGDSVVVRLHRGQRDVADRVWANLGRVTGVLTERSAATLTVDEGATRRPQVVTLHPAALGRIQVRFPTLEPGYLVDIIGLREREELIGMIPATSQPSYPADRLPSVPLVAGHVARTISGSATWHEPHDEPPGVLGVDYPALDPETGCAEDAATGLKQGYARLPYLAIGSVLRIKNDCSGSGCLVPVTGCASIARLFNDRCVTCGTSPRGRIADLTLATFIALGGEPERGCFNATVTIGE